MQLLEDKIGYAAADHGVLLGKTSPSKQTKFSWFEVFYHKGKIVACVYAGLDGDFCCCEEVRETELGSYVEEDIDIVREKLRVAKQNDN